jgi:hypothetical protein
MSAERARRILHDLLDRIERRSEAERARPVSRKLPMSFADGHARDAFEAVLRDAAATGAVTLEPGKGELGHLLARVRLADGAALYAFLARTPVRDQAARAVDRLRRDTRGLTHVRDVRDEIAASWAHDRTWLGLGKDDAATAAAFLTALDAVRRGDFGRRDMRTVSRKRTGDSKLIERHAGRIARWLKATGQGDETATARETLAAIGLEKHPQDIKVAGAVAIDGAALPELAFLGIPADAAERISPVRADTLITVENLASFQRYAREARRPNELVIYTGGFPARAVGRAIAAVAPRMDALWHWGDIDAAGLRIALVVQRHAGRPVRLWMMEPDLAERFGRRTGAGDPGPLPDDAPAATRRLADYLRRADARTLEQEELDPVSPSRAVADAAR